MTPTQPHVEVILDSIAPDGIRLTTIRGVFHRFILAEVNTHRRFSRNSASSRAKSFSVTSEQIQNDTAFPTIWTGEQRGMVGGTITDQQAIEHATILWQGAAKAALDHAQALHNAGIHKSLCNRLLEPFMWHEAIITSTGWDNFFRQRCSSQAQPEMKAFADAVHEAITDSIPIELRQNVWHLPFVTAFNDKEYDRQQIEQYANNRGLPLEQTKLQVSAARCARVSYKTVGEDNDIANDLTLFERLLYPPLDEQDNRVIHLSPMEHQARISKPYEVPYLYNVGGNFGLRWYQFRQQIEVQQQYRTMD